MFKLPTDTSTDYIKRIVGLPGDNIQMIHGQLFINDQMVPRRQVEDCLNPDGGTTSSCANTSNPCRAAPASRRSIIASSSVSDEGRSTTPRSTRCPQGYYFAMGDNRDNSQDSRAMSAVGYIPAENLVGRAAVPVLLDRRLGCVVGSLEMAVGDPLQSAAARCSRNRSFIARAGGWTM